LKKSLIYRFINQQQTRQELQSLHEEVHRNEDTMLKLIEEDWDNFQLEKPIDWPDYNWNQIQEKICSEKVEDTSDNVFRLQWWVKIAATLLVVVSV